MAKKEAKKPDPAPEAEGADGEAAPKKKPPIMIIAAVGAVLLLGGGGAGAYFMFFNKPAADPHAEEAADAHAEKKDDHGKKKDDHGKKKDDGHGKKKDDGHGGGGDAVDPKTQPVVTEGPDGVSYFTLPSFVANIQAADNKAQLLKLKLTFEVRDHDAVELLKSQLPRINDVLQGFIRELRPEDLAGSEGNYQLRLEILRRINLILAPSKIDAVLIEEMLMT